MIAIAMVVHNQLFYTKQVFQSIARNSYPYNLGFFVLDNGSSDGSWEWMNAQLHGRPQMLYRNEGNDSLSGAWNKVLRAGLDCGADLLVLMNNDVIVGPGWLDQVVREYAKGEKTYWLANGGLSPENYDERVRAQPKEGRLIPGRAGWCLFFPAAAVREFYPIPTELKLWYGDDWIHWKLAKAGYSCRVAMDSYVYHYGSKTMQTRKDLQPIIDADRETYFRLTGERL